LLHCVPEALRSREAAKMALKLILFLFRIRSHSAGYQLSNGQID